MKNCFYLIQMLFIFVGAQHERVAGGHIARKGQFPFFASVKLPKQGHQEIRGCGGSLIHPQWILTAAHCLENTMPFELNGTVNGEVKMGFIYVFDKGAVTNRIDKLITHPYYQHIVKGKHHVVRNNIGLIKLEEPYKISKYVGMVLLPFQNGSASNLCQSGVVMGTGVTLADTMSNYLRYTRVKVSKRRYQDLVTNSPTFFYSKSSLVKGHPLYGDSGSPFVCFPVPENKHLAIQFGVVSGGINITEMGYIIWNYEDVSKHISFIKDAIPEIEGFSHNVYVQALKYRTESNGPKTNNIYMYTFISCCFTWRIV